jgi:hypothetical protein
MQNAMSDEAIVKKLDRLEEVATTLFGNIRDGQGAKSKRGSGKRDPDFKDAKGMVQFPQHRRFFRTVCLGWVAPCGCG